ncbi:glycerate kinase [Aeromicrobium senzhongii]|uniref:Glycerate kinase n=1 Tax=Aeromicrobium senzhongii TaxID=2663859 RepID=A0ABX6SVM2_9ACTN|nr:glycerate kinase [Aeromicrobium senzhongii]MTB87520.1 glycerate kinase [Aeromicrobium senzhongii]QNL95438.1 glycerate kinase [Aeromicrobium senzhongii]
MRIVVAPDKFAGTLTAPEAARAIAEGWRRSAPGDELVEAPMADGGPGFADALHSAFGGASRIEVVTVPGPLGEPTPVGLLLHGDTAYLESAQACGLHLVGGERPMDATTVGVGRALAAAVDGGARRIVIGLGGSATTDGGAGLLAALGATADVPLDAGPAGLDGVNVVDLEPVCERLAGVELVVAADVETTLLGMFGAARTFGLQKGLTDEQILTVDHRLDRFVEAVCGSTPAERRVADLKGAGAAGGLGFALMVLGAEVTSGIGLVAQESGLDELLDGADLVLSGEGAFDYSSRAGKVVHGVATVAMRHAVPCVVLAGRVDVGSREMRALGVESAYSLVDRVGVEAAMAEPARHLGDLAARVARSWSA